MKIVDGVLLEVSKSDCVVNNKFAIPNGVKEIGDYAFARFPFDSIIFSDSVKKIGRYSFRDCSNIKKIILPNVEYIGYNAFFACDSLQSVIFSDKTEIIDIGAFAYCRKLSEITLPPYVQSIGENAFYNMADKFTIVYNERQVQMAN